jgi:hypothetical protein
MQLKLQLKLLVRTKPAVKIHWFMTLLSVFLGESRLARREFEVEAAMAA